MNKIITLLFPALFAISTAAPAQEAKAQLNHLAIFVVNLQKSIHFYANIIGLDTIPDPFNDDKHAWYRIGVGTSLHIIEGAVQPKVYFLNNHICFSVQSVELFVAKLKKNNMGWRNARGEEMQITTRIDGVKQIWLSDPDGYWIEINDAKN